MACYSISKHRCKSLNLFNNAILKKNNSILIKLNKVKKLTKQCYKIRMDIIITFHLFVDSVREILTKYL